MLNIIRGTMKTIELALWNGTIPHILKKTGPFIEESRFSKNLLQLWNTAYLNIELQPLTLVLLSSSNSFCN